MKLTPLDIHHKEFRRAIRGYNEEEVDVFLDQVAEEFERVFKDNIDLKEQIEGMKGKVKQYEGVEQTLQRALMTAQTAADEVQNNAQKESDLIVKDAELKAKEIIQQVLTEKQNLQNEVSSLKGAEKEFREKFKSLLNQYLDVISKVEKGDRPAPVAEAPAAPEPVMDADEAPAEEAGKEPFSSAFDVSQEDPMAEGRAPVEELSVPEEPAGEEPSADAEPPTDSAFKPEPDDPEPEGKTDFGVIDPNIGSGESSFFGDAEEKTKNLMEEPAAAGAENEFKVTFAEPEPPAGAEVPAPEFDISTVTAVAEATPAVADEPEPAFAPAPEKAASEDGPEEQGPAVSSFFDDDLGVDEDEKKDDWAMLPAPAEGLPDAPKQPEADADDTA